MRARRLPRLWPPIVLISAGATLLVPSAFILTVALLERSAGGRGDPAETSEFRTLEGIGTLLLSSAALVVGVVWLRKRKAERRRLRKLERGEIAFAVQGLGARLQMRL